ncbi:LysR family transcriptional regulator [Noviherbaspirillum massiliense]|uniref:LysR family transcriptional regulator n=1 Tax=Noviherbaspirillum massiliense TaxID=1465823 RepID=UPI0002FD074B|nr:LysR family transcriptional regulator [Noviherbaspirillum massiliense]
MIHTSELVFFSAIVKAGSLSAAARELGLTPPSVSKRLAQMEQRLDVQLFNRTTRRLSLTNEGELYRASAMRLLAELEEMERLVSGNRSAPKGLLRVNAPLGFGRTYITPLVSKFIKNYPDVEVQLQLTDHPLNLVDEAFDLGIRFGALPDARLIAHKVAPNRRLLCAAPSYLKKHGIPKVPHDLTRHNCIVLRQNDVAYGTWHFSRGRHTESVKVRGALSSNDGEVTLNWALDGHGITLRAEWDTAKYLRSGRLVLVLEDYAAPPADIYAVYPERQQMSPKVRAFTEFLSSSFNQKNAGASQKSSVW